MSSAQLRSIVERAETLNSQIDDLNADKRDLFAEAKANGYDVKTIKAVIAYRRKDATVRAEQDALFALYLNEIGA